MRRGLKCSRSYDEPDCRFRRSEDSPMRRGLKSVLVDARIEHIAAIRRFPDEEGTEIGQSMPRVRHGTSMSIRRFPD